MVLAKDMRAFEARYGAGIHVAGEYGGWLRNGGETIIFKDPYYRTVLDFQYDDADAWLTRADGFGSSLEIVDPGGDYTRADNWRASSKLGGTPGADPDPELGIVINEVLSHSDPPDVDRIELHNTTGGEIDLDGWYLSDSGDQFQ